MKSIFLVGYMGCGKSTLGRKLARRLNIPFFDTDSLIEEREGASVNDIFHYEGEAYFRELERETIVQILAEEQAHVVSTG
ncbi:MAG: shikimate kinase, partial [Alistipes sp.]